MIVTVFPNSPPGGRCTLYIRYADAMARVLDDISVNCTYPGKDPASGPAAPALAIDGQVIEPSDGFIVAPEDIARMLAETGRDAAECLALLEQIQNDFIEEMSR